MSRVAPVPPAVPVAPPPSAVAEAELLQLAREVSALHAAGISLADVLAHVAAAWADGPLPLARSGAFVARRRDKTAALALAWAREQVRVALEEALQKERDRGRMAADAPLGTLSWILLAAAEALGWDPPGDVDERIAALLALSGVDAPVPR